MSYKRTFHTLFAGALLATGCLLATSASLFAQSTDSKVVAVAGEAAPQEPGVLITSARPDSPAAKAGLRRGDIVLSVDGVAVNSAEELRAKISSKKAGETVTLSVLHGDDTRELSVTLAPRDDTGVLGVTAEQDPAADVLFYNAQAAMPAQGGMPFSPAQPFNLPFPPGTEGVTTTIYLQIVEVTPDTPAAEAGLQAGEVIVALNGAPFEDPKSLNAQIKQAKPGDKVTLTVQSSPQVTETKQVEVTLGERPDQSGEAYLGIRIAPLIQIERQESGATGNFILKSDIVTSDVVTEAMPSLDDLKQKRFMLEVEKSQAAMAPMSNLAQGMICMPLAAGAVMAPGQPFSDQIMTMPVPPMIFWEQKLEDGATVSGSMQAPNMLQFEQAVPAPPSDEI